MKTTTNTLDHATQLEKLDFYNRQLIALSRTHREEWWEAEQTIKRNDYDDVIIFMEKKCKYIWQLLEK